MMQEIERRLHNMTKQEYEAKFHANQKVTGFGLEVTMHMPCPACAEPDFVSYKILEMKKVLTESVICKHCGFGSKAIFNHDNGGVSFEFVQTAGGDLPDYLPPMRRV